ncbi:hypothetical protein L7F22_057433 [Adiantum nelumboides]|nr:hypothetical protein [Adiantum nelumboides]
MPIITHNKAKGVDHADEIPISMTQESGSSHGTNSIIEPSNITTLDLVPSSMVPTSDTPSIATNEPLSDCFGKLVDSHILTGYIDSHILPYSHLLLRIPLCRLLANPAIRTQDDCVTELTTLIAERGYQPTMARFIVTECFLGQSLVQFDRRGVRGQELHMSASFDDQILQISKLKHMEEKMFVVWNGNHRLHAWREWAYHEILDEFSTPRVECTLVALNPTEMAESLLVLSMINKVTRVHVPHTTAHDIFMMQKLGLADPKSILDKFDDEDRAKAKRVLRGTAMNHSKWLRLPMALLSQLLWKMCRKCQLLGLLASGDAALKEAGIPSNEKPFSQWLRMHVYWWQLERGLQDIRKLLGSLLYTGQMDPNARLGGVRLMWADLPTHCKVDAGFGGVPLWNVFTDGIVQSVFTIAVEFLLDNGTLVVACRAEHLFKVISEACEFQFCHIRTLFLRMPSHTYVMDCNFTDPVATLIVTMFVRDLYCPLPVPFYDRRARDIAADIDGCEADSDMLREPLRESSWTLDTSGAAFRASVEKSKWLIGTFTIVGDAVLDCMPGCGYMATECKRLHRYCISIEKDVVVFRSLLFPQLRLPGEVGTILHYSHFSRSEELERATSLQPPAQPPIPHFYPPPTPQPPGIAQWPYGPSYPPPYTFMRPHSAWPPIMGGRPPLQRPLFAPPPMEPPPPPGQYPPPPPPQL